MLDVRFYDSVDDDKLKFAVIVSKSNGKWVFCKHKEREIWECPGGHREQGEDILDTAKRELYEETGAVKFTLNPVCVYSVADGENETFGMLYFAEITEFENELHSEIEKIKLFDDLPQSWTYPLIQPRLLMRVREFTENKV